MPDMPAGSITEESHVEEEPLESPQSADAAEKMISTMSKATLQITALLKNQMAMLSLLRHVHQQRRHVGRVRTRA